jgi:hypothetical protein
MAAYRKISSENLKKLESEDSIAAANLVRKDKVIEKYHPKTDKELGIDSGVAFIKQKIYTSLKNKPADSAFNREQYVELYGKI